MSPTAQMLGNVHITAPEPTPPILATTLEYSSNTAPEGGTEPGTRQVGQYLAVQLPQM